ncbi:hypothetical protein D3C76_1656150 [compost metagenome]
MQALISVRLRLGDIILDLKNPEVLTDTEMINQPVNILHKCTDNPHAGDIMNVLLHIFKSELVPFAFHLAQDALRLFYT